MYRCLGSEQNSKGKVTVFDCHRPYPLNCTVLFSILISVLVRFMFPTVSSSSWRPCLPTTVWSVWRNSWRNWLPNTGPLDRGMPTALKLLHSAVQTRKPAL